VYLILSSSAADTRSLSHNSVESDNNTSGGGMGWPYAENEKGFD
jgi:hypothetical protein